MNVIEKVSDPTGPADIPTGSTEELAAASPWLRPARSHESNTKTG